MAVSQYLQLKLESASASSLTGSHFIFCFTKAISMRRRSYIGIHSFDPLILFCYDMVLLGCPASECSVIMASWHHGILTDLGLRSPSQAAVYLSRPIMLERQ